MQMIIGDGGNGISCKKRELPGDIALLEVWRFIHEGVPSDVANPDLPRLEICNSADRFAAPGRHAHARTIIAPMPRCIKRRHASM